MLFFFILGGKAIKVFLFYMSTSRIGGGGLHSGFTQELVLWWEGIYSLFLSVSGLHCSGLNRTLPESALSMPQNI